MFKTLSILVISIFLVVAQAGLATKSFAAKTPAQDYVVKTRSRLSELHQELDNLKSREKSIPDDAKSAFREQVASVDQDWNDANDYATRLKAPTAKQKKEMALLIAKIEKSIDKTENAYGEKSFGLGGILGF